MLTHEQRVDSRDAGITAIGRGCVPPGASRSAALADGFAAGWFGQLGTELRCLFFYPSK